jgi:hypothetical protein
MQKVSNRPPRGKAQTPHPPNLRPRLQSGFVISTAVKHADDGYPFGFQNKGDRGPFPVIRDPQTRAYVVALDTAMRQSSQPLVIGDNGIGITRRNLRRGGICDLAIEHRKLFVGFRRKNDGVGHYFFVVALRCSLASLTRT